MAASPTGSVMARRKDMAVKIDAEVTRKAKIVAAYKDVSLAEYLSESLRDIVDRDLTEYAKRALDPHPKGGGPKGSK